MYTYCRLLGHLQKKTKHLIDTSIKMAGKLFYISETWVSDRHQERCPGMPFEMGDTFGIHRETLVEYKAN